LSRLYGSYTFSVDEKGRFSIPAEIRRGLAEEALSTFMVLPGFDGCLDAYPLDEWLKREEFLRSLPEDEDGIYYLRAVLSQMRRCKMDRHKRILVPTQLLRLVGIKDSVFIIGMLDHLEFWNPETYQQYLASRPVKPQDALKRTMQKFRGLVWKKQMEVKGEDE